MIDMLYGARNEIIGGIVLMLLAWCWHKFRVMLKKYKTMKHELDRMREEMTQIGATKEEHERLTAELQQKDEALSLSVTKAHEYSRLIEELRSQIETLQQEIQRRDEALSQSEAKAHEYSRLIEELRSQTEAQQKELQQKDEALSQSEAKINELQQELEREKARKKILPMSDDDFLELCKSGSAQKVKEAIMNGANVNAKDNNGWTALMLVTLNNHAETAELLLKHGADVDAKNNYGWTALSYASRIDTAKLLRKYGAK